MSAESDRRVAGEDAPERSGLRVQKLAIAVTLLVAAVVAVMLLLASEPRRSGVAPVPPDAFVNPISATSGPACVHDLSLPPKTAGLRTRFGTFGAPGPRIAFTLTDKSGKVIRRASVTGYGDGGSPIIRFGEFAGGIDGATACFGIEDGRLAVAGSSGGDPAAGDRIIEFIRPGSESLLSMLPTMMRRASLFRPGGVGPWTFYLLFVIVIGTTLAAALMLLRLAQGRRWGRTRLIALAAIVFVNAAAWAVLTPPFHVPDEFAHYAYVETLARGDMPQKSLKPGDPGNSYLPSSVLATEYTTVPVIQRPDLRPPWEASVERGFELEYANIKRTGDKPYGLTPANAYSPIYYAPAAVIHEAAGGAGLYTKLLLVRLWSALLAALSVMLVVLFARELLPSVPWFAPVAGLAVAFQPMFLHIGGGVNNDNLLVVCATAMLYLLARILRRGETLPLAAAAGATFAVGYLVKPTMLGLAPVAAFTFLLVLLRGQGSLRRRATVAFTAAATALVVLGLGIEAFGPVSNQAGSLTAGSGGESPSLAGLLSYVWQWYLPPLPFMQHFFDGTPPVIGVFVRGFIADFNALDTSFPNYVYGVMTLVLTGLVAGAVVAATRWRRSLPDRWPLIALAVVAAAGMAVFVNVSSYLVLMRDGTPFAQGRYLFPVLGVFGALVAAGSLGAGRRWALTTASVTVMLLAVLNLFGMGISLSRFYL